MKSTQKGASGSKKDSSYSQSHTQYSGTQNSNDLQSQAPGALANYTLPGVISYLTSEFTNLERFRIMTNLEKSEMKYRIQQLTGELNSLRFINEKQALRIKTLEDKLEKATFAPENEGKNIQVLNDSVNNELPKDVSLTGDPERLNDGPDSSPNANDMVSTKQDNEPQLEFPVTKDIPHVDLEFLRDSKRKLNASIREIASLLEPPSGIEFLDTHNGEDARSGFDDLLDNTKRLSLSPDHAERVKTREDVFARYTLGKDDMLTGQKISFDADVRMAGEPGQNDQQGGDQRSWGKTVPYHTYTDESDAETVSLNGPNTSGILSDDGERQNN
ncbi:Striatin-domain-containing protein [Metschnikowia bicuspidata var. bicuspidata NRRL YB-4993]|uniref:Striatin-domain-containing protein n=1 Tax=Metschnikowia bicuspidata var. bicuspidata NRRL YB-4993 TaxID=869754 RepID=A0A1A0HG61_9ASCO|nr:Striatin-domain-containing protein [Metschnikowia bicuspidata var. bicuspidata NRRL YB-4993]OBA22991.1 Striatin-domain-containing protein [Metschnikowia bicuspidata var. bicuspidata NRRL YB-4993]